MATKKVEEKVNLGKETVEETKKARKRTRAEMIRELKREASKIDIEVMNLTNGSFIYENGYIVICTFRNLNYCIRFCLILISCQKVILRTL